MHLNFMPRIAATVALTVGVGAAPTGAQEGDPFRGAFDLVPPDSAAAIVVPNLKAASDNLAQALEGMDRANVLFGGRPVDQLRALLGLTAGVNEQAPAAIVIKSAEMWNTPVFLVPVQDESDFMETNFDPVASGAPGAFVHHGTGKTVFARRLQNHVAISVVEDHLLAFNPGTGLTGQLTAMFDDAVMERARACDVFVYERADAVARAVDLAAEAEVLRVAQEREKKRQAKRAAKQQEKEAEGEGEAADEARPRRVREADAPIYEPPPGLQLTAIIPAAWWEGAETVLTGINLDPLGVGVHAFISPKDGSWLDELSGRAAAPGKALTRVPNTPFYLTGSLDLAGVGGSELFFRDMIDWSMLADQVSGAQFIASTSDLGVRGGLLNEASIFLPTGDAAGLIDAMKTQFELLAASEGDVLTLTGEWQDHAREIDGVRVHSYKIDVKYNGNNPRAAVIMPLAVGSGGLTGFVGEVEGGLIVTFSAKPTVFTRAVKAVKGESPLEENEVLRQMSAWLPETPGLVAFIGVGELGPLMTEMAAAMGPFLPDDLELPSIDAATKPIGIGVDVRPGVIETGIVMPADAAAVVFDAIMSRIELLEPAPARQ